jgi:hypothetical protein
MNDPTTLTVIAVQESVLRIIGSESFKKINVINLMSIKDQRSKYTIMFEG